MIYIILVNVQDYKNNYPIRKKCKLSLMTDTTYYTPFPTKYHVGDRFVHPGGITGIVTEVNERSGEYEITFIETSTQRTISTHLKVAWYTDRELDDFINTIDRNFNMSY